MRKIILAIFVLGASSANAGLITYTDRASFEAALSAFTIQDFESYASNTYFNSSAVDVGDFSISMTSGATGGSYNYIDPAPAATSESDVNGTNGMRVFTNSSQDLLLTFDSAILAFGADFANINDGVVRTVIETNNATSDSMTPGVVSYPTTGYFVGFISDSTFTQLTFNGSNNDVFGMDNITYNAVPEPASLLLLALGMLGMGLNRKKLA